MSTPRANVMAWIAALRSGQYTQGRGFLKSKGNYCCLGVLCEVAGWQAKEGTNGNSFFINPNNPVESVYKLPSKFIQNQFGLDEDVVDILITLNDGINGNERSSKSFLEIADYLEHAVLPTLVDEPVSTPSI